MFVEELWSQSSKWYQTWDNQLLYSRENGVRWAVILYRKSMGSVLVVWIQKCKSWPLLSNILGRSEKGKQTSSFFSVFLSLIINYTISILTFSRKCCHITQILKEPHWLPVTQRIAFKLLMTVYKCTNNFAPYLFELLSHYSPTRALRSRNKQLLQEAKSNCSWGDISFAYCSSFALERTAFWYNNCKKHCCFQKTVKNTSNVRFKLYFHIGIIFCLFLPGFVCSYLCCMPWALF